MSGVITISVKFQFNIREFPLSLIEIFLVINRVLKEVGMVLAKTLLKRLEEEAFVMLKAAGCCYHKRVNRTFKGVLGRIDFQLLKVKHPDGTPRYALADWIALPDYVRCTQDSLEPVMGLLPHLSYQRSSLEGERIQGSSPSKSTIHRRLKGMAKDVEAHPVEKVKGYQYLIADGTGSKFQRPYYVDGKKRIETYKGELRVVYASRGPGQPFDVIGRWTETSWQDIAKAVFERVDGSSLQYLISDGEAGIEKAFLLSHMKHQRCSVHVWNDLKHFLYQDGAKKDAQRPVYKLLMNTPVFEYAKQSAMEALAEKDRPEVSKQVQESEKQLFELSELLHKKGYGKTAKYIENLSGPLLTFLKEWIETGNAIPATSNIAESRFSLFKNRIARIGKRWSEDGLKRLFDLAVHKLFPGYDWNKLWDKLLPLTGNISCKIIAVH